MRAAPTLLVAASLLLGAGGIASAASTASAPKSVKACVSKKGLLGVPGSNGKCAKGFSSESIAAKGATGARGATGAQGVQGLPGIQGVPGPQGPGAVSSYLHTTTNTHTSPLTTTLAVPGTGVSVVSTCAVTYDSTAYARLDIKSGAGYLEGTETATFGGSGSAAINTSGEFAAGANNVATNTQGDSYVYAYAGSGSSVNALDLQLVDTTTAKPTIVGLHATVISEQGECLAVVTATPSANSGS